MVYTVAGNSGQMAPMSDSNGHRAHYTFTATDIGSVVVDMDSSTLTARFIDEHGAEFDHFVIRR